jgi:acetyl-CoA carboxylase carboxyl transferase subunit alpha
MTANDIVELGIADKILKEPLGGAHNEWDAIAATIKNALLEELNELLKLSKDEIKNQRYNKFRSFGKFKEPKPA